MTELKRIIYTRRTSCFLDLNRVHKAGAKFDPDKKQMVQSSILNDTKR
jgi:hypothetical protein